LVDVAAAAGVSKSVASRALAGAADISDSTKARVRLVAQQMGYHASVRARSLGQRSGGRNGRGTPLHAALVSLHLAPEILGASLLGAVLAGIMSGAADEGLEMQHVVIRPEDGTVADALGRLVAEDRADGFVLLTLLPLQPADVAPLDQAGVPYVLVNRHFDDAHPVDCVTFAWETAAQDAVQRLFGAGHRTMALLLPDHDNTSVTGRATGWRAGVQRCGLRDQDAAILRYTGTSAVPQDSLVHGRALARRLLCDGLPTTGEVPTALVGFNDWCALGILRAAAEAGVTVPDHLSVIGFDNTLIGVASSPPLCSYAPRSIDLGRHAAARLAAALRGERTDTSRLDVPVDFICRGSCGPAPAAPRAVHASVLAGAPHSLARG
jgi:LacI family transcriptional regulator